MNKRAKKRIEEYAQKEIVRLKNILESKNNFRKKTKRPSVRRTRPICEAVFHYVGEYRASYDRTELGKTKLFRKVVDCVAKEYGLKRGAARYQTSQYFNNINRLYCEKNKIQLRNEKSSLISKNTSNKKTKMQIVLSKRLDVADVSLSNAQINVLKQSIRTKNSSFSFSSNQLHAIKFLISNLNKIVSCQDSANKCFSNYITYVDENVINASKRRRLRLFVLDKFNKLISKYNDLLHSRRVEAKIEIQDALKAIVVMPPKNNADYIELLNKITEKLSVCDWYSLTSSVFVKQLYDEHIERLIQDRITKDVDKFIQNNRKLCFDELDINLLLDRFTNFLDLDLSYFKSNVIQQILKTEFLSKLSELKLNHNARISEFVNNWIKININNGNLHQFESNYNSAMDCFLGDELFSARDTSVFETFFKNEFELQKNKLVVEFTAAFFEKLSLDVDRDKIFDLFKARVKTELNLDYFSDHSVSDAYVRQFRLFFRKRCNVCKGKLLKRYVVDVRGNPFREFWECSKCGKVDYEC